MINKNFPNYTKHEPANPAFPAGDNRHARRKIAALDRGRVMRDKQYDARLTQMEYARERYYKSHERK